MSDHAPDTPIEYLTKDDLRDVLSQVLDDRKVVTQPTLQAALNGYVTVDDLNTTINRVEKSLKVHLNKRVDMYLSGAKHREDTFNTAIRNANEHIQSWHKLLNTQTDAATRLSNQVQENTKAVSNIKDELDDIVAYRMEPLTKEVFGDEDANKPSLSKSISNTQTTFEINLERFAGKVQHDIQQLSERLEPVEMQMKAMSESREKWDKRSQFWIDLFSGRIGAIRLGVALPLFFSGLGILARLFAFFLN